MTETKRCRACTCDLGLSAFWKGWPLCKECDRARRAANADAIRARDRERDRRPDRQASRKQRREAAEQKFPERRAARMAVHNAILAGRIVRSGCEVCGESNAQAHHDDYSRPLSIRWLCALHHAQHHAREAAALKTNPLPRRPE